MLQDSVAPRVTEAEAAFAAKRAPEAFALVRQALREAAQEAEPWLLLGIDSKGRLATDLTRWARMRAATLSADAAAAYLADAEAAAASEIGRALTLREIAARAAAYPRTAAAARALELVAARRMELGDLCGARSAWERLLDSGGGTPQTRANWWIRAAAVAAALRDALPTGATEAELNTTIPWNGRSMPLAEALRTLEPAAAKPNSGGALVERWRLPIPKSALPPNAAEPVERLAVEAGDAIVVQTAGELLEIDPNKGVITSRAPLDSADPSARRPVNAPGAPPRAMIGFPGKRRARPSTDGRFVATTAAGILRVFERTDAGLKLRWTRGSGFPLADLDEPNPNKPADVRLYCDGALLLGGRLFVASVLVGSDTTTSLECFDPVAGERHFERAISKGSVLESKDERRFAARLEVVLPEPLAYRGGRVIVSTNMGIVASVDPLDGELDYVLRIERSEHPSAYEQGAPAALGPAIAVCSPDSDFAYALAPRLPTFNGRAPLPFAFDGAPMSRKDGKNEPLLKGAFRRPVGAVGTRALFLGNVQVVRRKVQGFDFAARAYDDDELGPGEEPLGLPAIVGNRIHVPTNHGIVSIEVGGAGAGQGSFRDVAQTPLPVDAATRQTFRGEDILGDLSPVAGGLVSVNKNWIVRYDESR
jgi:hypothetical protein